MHGENLRCLSLVDFYFLTGYIKISVLQHWHARYSEEMRIANQTCNLLQLKSAACILAKPSFSKGKAFKM
jgi:hypothetical protein